MGQVVFNISMSLDGFVTAPDDRFERRLGDGGESLHDWCRGGKWVSGEALTSPTAMDRQVLDEIFSSPGALVIGRGMFDVNHWWDEEPPFGVPIFVVTHRPHQKLVNGSTTFTFVTDGIESALDHAKAVAGDRDVGLFGGADIAQQYLRAGLVDEMEIHLAPVLLGAGKRLFDHIDDHISLEMTRVLDSPFATHLRYRVVKHT
jgi:dihydrofolate reductase